MCYIITVHKDADRDSGLEKMIADHMEAGFLENIIDMFRHDKRLYSFIGELILDERVRVRIGVTALMEELKKLDSGNIAAALPNVLRFVSHKDPVVRGDISNLLGIIGCRDALPHLEKLMKDDNPNVTLIAKEAIEDINRLSIQPNPLAPP